MPRTSFSQWLACLTVLLIAARAILPVGWMLEQDNTTGAVQIVMCGGGDHSTALWLDPTSRKLMTEAPPQSPDTNTTSCPFALMASAATPPETAQTIEPLMFVVMLGARPIARDQLYSRPLVILPPSRGPPSHA